MAEQRRRRVVLGFARQRWVRVALGVVVLGAVGAAVLGMSRGAVEVDAARVVRSDLVETIVATGRVLPPARIEVGTTVLGVVQTVAVEEGDRVASGQVLVTLDDEELRAAAAAARAAVDQARLAVDAVRRTGSPVAREGLVQAELELDRATRQSDRVATLRRSGAVSQSEADEAQAALDAARSRLRQADLALRSSAGTEQRTAQAALAQAEANLVAAEVRLGRATITAPSAGMVLQRTVEPGDVVQPGRVLLVLARDGDTQLVVPVDERNLAGLETGRRATAAAEAFPARPFEAVVERIAPMVDADRGTIDVRLRVPAPPPVLRADMTVTVEVELARRQGALSVPVEALASPGGARTQVFVLRDGVATAREVRLGVRGETMAEVISGLAEGEQVLLPGSSGFEAGQRVHVRTVR